MSETASIQMSASAGGPMRMARIVNGTPTWLDVDQDEQAAYTPPPSNKYHLKITGIAETWKKPKKAEWIKPGGPIEDTMTRIEFEIQDGKGKGKKFSSLVNCVINPKSNLGQVWLAAVGAISPSLELTDLLGKELEIYVDRKEGTDQNGNKVFYANPTWSTAKAVGDATEVADDGWEAA
jgi:hypothetical protein